MKQGISLKASGVLSTNSTSDRNYFVLDTSIRGEGRLINLELQHLLSPKEKFRNQSENGLMGGRLL